MNLNQSDLQFLRIDSDWKFSLDQSELRLIQITLDWILGFELVRIHSDWCLGIHRIKSDWFLTVFHQTRYKMFFGLVRNDSHWLGYTYRNEFQSDTFARALKGWYLWYLKVSRLYKAGQTANSFLKNKQWN